MSATVARRAAFIAWGVVATSFLLTAGSVIVVTTVGPIVAGQTRPELMGMVPPLLFGITGAVVASNRYRNPIGWLMVAIAALWAVQGAFGYYALLGFERDPTLWGAGVASALYQTMWAAPMLALPAIFLLFPTGRPVTHRWRFAVYAMGIPASVLVALSVLALPHGGPEMIAAGEEELVPGTDALIGLFIISVVALVAVSVASLVVRFRRAATEERNQIKFLILGGATVVVSAVTSNGLGLSTLLADAISFVAFALVPVSILMAILRYRLYDIDRLINRALVYVAVTAIIVAVYVACVVLLQAVLPTDGSDLAVAVSTLAVAAIFGSARRAVQGFVDRRFYRARYDAKRELSGFSRRLRDQVDVTVISSDVLGFVSSTMRPTHAGLWLTSSTRNDSRTVAP